MGLFKKPIENAISSREAARIEAQEWESKATAMLTEANQLDESANAAILQDDTAAERITIQVNTWQRKAKAHEQAAREARAKVDHAAKEVLRIEADELDKEAGKISKVIHSLKMEISKAQAALEQIAGYRVAPVEVSNGVTDAGRLGQLNWNALHLQTQAQVIRYWLDSNELPRTLNDLNAKYGDMHETSPFFAGTDNIDKYGDPITDNLREALEGK